jgi:glycosyltransferase involved in cell wall biosynthesis
MAASAEHRPLVSVVLPAYNAGTYLVPALRSMVEQTFADLEILLLDDGSTDGAVDRAVEAVPDPRIRVLRHENRGLAPTLNRGILEARGEIVARMDADDVSAPDRIRRQVQALLAHPEVVLVGGQIVRRIGGGEAGRSAFPCTHDRIVRGLLATEHVLCHPAVAFRASAARRVGGYWTHGVAEDWDFFLRMSEVGELANLPDVVLDYRFHDSGINASTMAVVRRNMRLAAINHRRRARGAAELSPEDLDAPRWLPVRASIALQVRSLRAYRGALLAAAAGRRAAAAAGLLLSALLWPTQATRRVTGSVRRMASRPAVVRVGP